MYELYSNRYSGHSYKVAMLLALAGVRYRLIDVDLAVPRCERSIDFRRDSRFLEVPVLIDGANRICQSNQILAYLSHKLGGFSGSSEAERLRIGEWLFWESNRIGFSVSNLCFYRRFRAPISGELESFLNSRAIDDLSVLDAALRQDNFLAGESATIADLSCSGYLYWAGIAGIHLKDWPNIQIWLKKISDLPGWRRPEELLMPSGAGNTQPYRIES